MSEIDLNKITYSYEFSVKVNAIRKKDGKKFNNYCLIIHGRSAKEIASSVEVFLRKDLKLAEIKTIKPCRLAFAYHSGTYNNLTQEEKESIPMPEAYINNVSK